MTHFRIAAVPSLIIGSWNAGMSHWYNDLAEEYHCHHHRVWNEIKYYRCVCSGVILGDVNSTHNKQIRCVNNATVDDVANHEWCVKALLVLDKAEVSAVDPSFSHQEEDTINRSENHLPHYVVEEWINELRCHEDRANLILFDQLPLLLRLIS